MKGLNPGPTLFTERASSMYALYIIFIMANIIMIPLGIIMIRIASMVLRAPRASAMMPVIVLLCAVGAFATGNNLFAVLTVAAFGVIGFVMERNGYPVAAMVLGLVMGCHGRAEPGDVHHQVRWQCPAVLQPARCSGAGGLDDRRAAVAYRAMGLEPDAP